MEGILLAVTDEITQLDLDYDLFCHLADEKSIERLRAERVTSELIEDSEIAAAFEWQIEHIRDHGTPASGTVIEEEWEGLSLNPPQTAIGDLIERIRERYMRNQGRTAIRNLYERAYADPLTVAKDMQREGRRLAELTVRRGESYGSDDHDRWLRNYKSKERHGLGPSLGFPEVDAHFNGQLGVTFIIAPPKTYKSWANINAMARNVERGKFAFGYSLELPADEATGRLNAMAGNVPYWRQLKHVLTDDDNKQIKDGLELLHAHGGRFEIEKPNQGERSVQFMVERAINAGADCIFIDQLQYVEARNGHSLGALNNTGDYFEVVNDLRNYSDEIPILVVHQFNRSVMNAKGMPEMQQVKGSAAIEEVATLMLGMWASKEMRQDNEIHLGTLASRNYSYASWKLGVHLSRGCELRMLGTVEDEEE